MLFTHQLTEPRLNETNRINLADATLCHCVSRSIMQEFNQV